MRRTKISEQGGIGPATGHGEPRIRTAPLRRTPSETLLIFDFSRLLPGGQAHATVPDALRPSPTGAAGRVAVEGPEPGVGFGEEELSTARSQTMRLLLLHAFNGAGVLERNDEHDGGPCLPYHAN